MKILPVSVWWYRLFIVDGGAVAVTLVVVGVTGADGGAGAVGAVGASVASGRWCLVHWFASGLFSSIFPHFLIIRSSYRIIILK